MIASPRLVIAGTHSGAGKTTVATALMAALARRGLRVQPFKVGPDFIDPTFHRAASGRAGRNLDGWMLSRESNLRLFERNCQHADIAILEGVMGLFDGLDGASEAASTAEMAKWLNAPVVLVVDASAMARSAAALVHGFESFDPDVNVAAVLFNRVAGEGHYAFLREAVSAHCRADSVGFTVSNSSLSFPDRHLGLVVADEFLSGERLSALANWIESTVDLDRLLEIASRAPTVAAAEKDAPEPGGNSPRARVGIARDRAFCFYYQDNLDLLNRFGAELVEFSPMDDPVLPERLDGLYLGGGYPELHASRLAANARMRVAIRKFAQSGAPVYAECGGFMYLTEGIVLSGGEAYPMAGVFPTRAVMQRGLAAIGYAEAEETSTEAWLCPGERVRGHEFRYSAIEEMPQDVSRSYRATVGRKTKSEGFTIGSVLGSYLHLHFGSCPQFAARFISKCAEHRYLKERTVTREERI